MTGIINWYVLSKIFGDDFQLTGALIDNISDKPLERNLSIELIINAKVINPPDRWNKWDKVYVKIDFSFVDRLRWKIVGKDFIINSISVEGRQTFFMSIKDKKCNILEFDFGAARIQSVKPLIFSKQFDRYEVNDT